MLPKILNSKIKKSQNRYMQKVEYGDHLKNYFFFKNLPSVEELSTI